MELRVLIEQLKDIISEVVRVNVPKFSNPAVSKDSRKHIAHDILLRRQLVKRGSPEAADALADTLAAAGAKKSAEKHRNLVKKFTGDSSPASTRVVPKAKAFRTADPIKQTDKGDLHKKTVKDEPEAD